MPNFNPLPLDVLNSREYALIPAGTSGRAIAIASIATQLSTYPNAAAVADAVLLLKDVIEDVVRIQLGNCVYPSQMSVPSYSALGLTDATMQTAITNLLGFLNGPTGTGVLTQSVPPVGALPLKNVMGALIQRIVDSFLL
jgi:hypothetical protein